MPMKPVIQHLPPIFLTILVVCLTLGYGQDRKIWSPPGKSFTVEVPADLKEFDAGYQIAQIQMEMVMKIFALSALCKNHMYFKYLF